jgi:protein-tyrosine phosphatase
MRPVTLPPDVPGRLFFRAMPGRFEAWSCFLDEARRVGLTHVLCLAPLDEVGQLAPAYRQAIDRGDLPFRWRHAPMRNFGLPMQLEAFRAEISRAADALRAGDAVMLHCAAGIGRTGSAGVCLLKHLGAPLPSALQAVRDAGGNPESAEQSGLVREF